MYHFAKRLIQYGLLIGTMASSITGCALFSAYTPPVDQGKHITQQQRDMLKKGMDQNQVTYLLGTPDIIDPFDEHQWAYVFTFQKPRQPIEEKKLILIFDQDDQLKTIKSTYE